MEVSSFELKADIKQWDENDVHAWLTSLGYPQYGSQIREHGISGDVLCLMDAESLKEVGVETIGQRLAILKAVYHLKLARQIPIEPEDYVPPSEVEERQENLSVERLYEILRDQGDRLRMLEDENRRLSDSVHICLDDLNGLRAQPPRPNEAESPVNRTGSFKWASFVKSTRSPTKTSTSETVIETPQASPQKAEHDVNANSARSPAPTDKVRSQTLPHTSNGPASASTSAGPSSSVSLPTGSSKPSRQDSSDNLKSFKVSLDDPAWKVLPAALKKYKINNDDWQNYAMFICYGSAGNRIERCLSYDEKPLLLFQKLKDGKKNPVFMLKHIKDIRSPIAVAQQKQAARKASSASESGSVKSPPLTGASPAGPGHARQPSQDRTRPPRLQVNPHIGGVAPAIMTGGPNATSNWPEILSPVVDKNAAEEQAQPSGSGPGPAEGDGANANGREFSMPLTDTTADPSISYAVAIYPYMAEQDDEFDVVVGDTFVILSRARGWWVVQRDPHANGIVESDPTRQGWVPAGCLLETKVPLAAAIAEARGSGSANGSSSSPTSPTHSTPILPLNILSTSFPGIALTEYKKKGEEELDLAKDDTLRVFKRYNHWSYAVKEESGERGWVPSWYIGKIPQPSSAAPATPSTSGAPNTFTSTSLTLDGDAPASGVPQCSPMSSAFPPISRTAVA